MIQNQVGAGLAPLGNFCNIARFKMPKDARPALDGFSNLRVSATPNHKKVHTYSCFGFTPLVTRLKSMHHVIVNNFVITADRTFSF